MLPIFTESSLLSLALASGLISDALGLDERPIPNPATGKSFFTFDLKLHSSINKIFKHHMGQVEIDTLFLGRKSGKDNVYVVEAKIGYQNLAKHKLVYPILSIAKKVPEDIGIVPVFLSIFKKKEGFHYHVIECDTLDPRKNMIAINQLKIKNIHTWYYQKYFRNLPDYL